MPSFSRLIRFLAKDGKTYYGDAILPSGVSDVAKTTQARVITGDIFGNHTVTEQVADIKRLLSPLAAEHIRNVRCVGLNYKQHAAEANLPEPENPVLFFKPTTAAAGPVDDIPVAPVAADAGPELDYEGELVIVIGKQGRDLDEADALDYVLGYATGNDVSHRSWQLKRGGGQWSYGKSFDGWAPFGPGIVTSQVLPKGASGLRVTTKVNGETRQDGNTADFIFPVARVVSFFSQGSTLLPGDLIFTGTPSGVALAMKPTPGFVCDGDLVEISIEGIGTIANKMKLVQKGTSY